MVVTTQVNCKATSKNIEKSQQVFQDQPIKIETVQRIYLSCQILYVINLLKGTLPILNCDAPFGLQLDQAENKQFLSNSAFHYISSDVYLYFMVVLQRTPVIIFLILVISLMRLMNILLIILPYNCTIKYCA